MGFKVYCSFIGFHVNLVDLLSHAECGDKFLAPVRLLGSQLRKLFDRSSEARVRESVPRGAYHVLSYVSIVSKGEPASHIDVLKVEIGARIRLVAADDTRWQNALCGIDVPQSNILNGNSRLGVALLDDWVQHATWAIAIGLLLLLGPDIDTPPNRHPNGKVFI